MLCVNILNTTFQGYWKGFEVHQSFVDVVVPEAKLAWSGLAIEHLTPLAQLIAGLIGVLIMTLTMPRSVKDRAIHHDPSYSVVCDLPFDRRELYYALLDSEKPLGIPEAKVSVTASELIKEPKECRIVSQGATRTINIGSGTVESKLLSATEPSSIVWKQVSSSLPRNMYGSGAGDEPGARISLSPMGKLTRLTLDYFYTELDTHLWLGDEKETFPDAAGLTQRFTDHMKAKGFVALDEKPAEKPAAPAATAPSAATKFVQPAADAAEEAAIKNRAAASAAPEEAPLPPASPLPAPGSVNKKERSKVASKTSDASWIKSSAGPKSMV